MHTAIPGPEVSSLTAPGASPLDEATSRAQLPLASSGSVEDPTAEEVKELQAQLQRGVGRSVEALSAVFLGKDLGQQAVGEECCAKGPPKAGGEIPPPQLQWQQQSTLVAELLQAVMSSHSFQSNQSLAASSSGMLLGGGDSMDALAVSGPQGDAPTMCIPHVSLCGPSQYLFLHVMTFPTLDDTLRRPSPTALRSNSMF